MGYGTFHIVESMFSLMSEKNAKEARKGVRVPRQVKGGNVNHPNEIIRVLLILTRVKVGLGRFIQGGQYVALH